MTRGKLVFVPGIVWHITHRCHNRSYLLKFHRDKKRWLYWLFKAKAAYGLKILNYAITSNHIHLLVLADQRRSVIPQSIQLVAGRTAWEYNRRKSRRGAFWEGPYHATAVQDDNHLHECMAYIDLNMVRAGVVDHPQEWRFCGYKELMGDRQRYCLIDKNVLMGLMQARDWGRWKKSYSKMIESALEKDGRARDRRWSECIAVGTESFVKNIKEKIGYEDEDSVPGENTRGWRVKIEID